MVSIGKRIAAKRRLAKLNTTDLAKLTGLSQSFLSRVERGESGISEDNLIKVAGALKLSVHRLLEPEDSNVSLISLPGKPLPVLDYVQAGRWMSVQQGLADSDVQEHLLANADTPPSSFFLRIRGNSMEPTYREGDVVLIAPTVQPRPGDCVVATDENGDATFKKYRDVGVDDNGRSIFELVALNDDYGTLRSDRMHIAIVGTMTEHRRYRNWRSEK